jgi:hypothetical protein
MQALEVMQRQVVTVTAEASIVDLTLAIVAINAWNRLSVIFQAPSDRTNHSTSNETWAGRRSCSPSHRRSTSV